MADALKKEWDCPICLAMIPLDTLEITNCGHYYCKPCLDALKAHAIAEEKPKYECAVCKRKFKVGGDDE
jgi:hypothetical protein